MSLAICHVARDVLGRNHGAVTPLRLARPDARCDMVDLIANNATLSNAGQHLRRVSVFALTHSLGSFLVIDAQQRAAVDRATASRDVQREALAFALLDDATVFMFANQVSLLELGRVSVGCMMREREATCPNRAPDRRQPVTCPAPARAPQYVRSVQRRE